MKKPTKFQLEEATKMRTKCCGKNPELRISEGEKEDFFSEMYSFHCPSCDKDLDINSLTAEALIYIAFSKVETPINNLEYPEI